MNDVIEEPRVSAVPASKGASHPSFAQAFRFWLKLGFISFGGPTGQIAVMHTELVERRRWIGEDRFLQALNFCMLLPGPEAQQLATFTGWSLHGTRGAIAAGTLFVLPSVALLWLLSWIYVTCNNLAWVAATFDGLKPAVVAIVAHAVLRIGRRALRRPTMWLVSALAFAAIFFARVPFPLIILTAGVIGFIVFRRNTTATSAPSKGQEPGGAAAWSEATPVRASRALRVILICLALWWAPVALTAILLGPNHAVVHEGVFFSKAAMVTFGGAYAVLPYVAQQAVERYGWLSAEQMLDGLGLAETTPGPLIMVVQFVGFLGGWNQPGGLSPLVAATWGAILTTWVTFVPCFLWILAGAPYVERVQRNPRLAGALATITAAVVGVVLNLAVWFAWHTFAPDSGPWNGFAVALSVVCFLALWRGGAGIVPVVAVGALAGFAHHLLGA